MDNLQVSKEELDEAVKKMLDIIENSFLFTNEDVDMIKYPELYEKGKNGKNHEII